METPTFNKFINIDDFTEESKPLISDYTCPLCKGIYYNPVIDMCGHIFCEQCFNLHFKHKRICPIDNVPLDATPTKVRPLSVVLEKQILKCKNRIFGCEWTGPLKDFQEHINKDCMRQTVMCQWIGCGDSVFREDLPLHDGCCEYRVIKCKYCEIQLAFNQLKMHQELCPKFMLPCPQECGQNVERELIERHILDDCLNTIMQCPYMKYGCVDTVIKRDLEVFLDKNRIKHEAMTMNLIDRLLAKIGDIEEIMNTMKNKADMIGKEEEEKEPIAILQTKHRRDDEEAIDKESATVNEEIKPTEMLPIQQEMQLEQPMKTEEPMQVKMEIEIELQEESIKQEKPTQIEEKKTIQTEPQQPHKNEQPIQVLQPIQLDQSVQQVQSIQIQHQHHQPLQEEIDKEPLSLFDQVYLPPEIWVSCSKAKCISNLKKEHKYLFSALDINCKNKNVITTWTVTVLHNESWIGLGICDKKKVIENKLKFYSSLKTFNTGTFLISLNGYTWNCNVEEENNEYNEGLRVTEKKDVVFTYDPNESELTYRVGKVTGKFTKVAPILGNMLTPCFVFLDMGGYIDYKPNMQSEMIEDKRDTTVNTPVS